MNKSFDIYIFNINNIMIDSDINKTAQRIDISTANYIVNDRDITDFNWKYKNITFKNKKSPELENYMLTSGFFVIEFDGKRLFGGRIVPEFAAESINYPVLMYKKESMDNQYAYIIYSLRVSTAINANGPYPFPVIDSAAAEQIKAHFQALGTLTE